MYHEQAMPPSSWLPPVLWMALLLALSSDAGSAEHTAGLLRPLLAALAPWATPPQVEAVHFLLRKGAHVGAYAVLAALWFRSFRLAGRSRRASAAVAFVLAVVWGALDEARQSTVPSRTGAAGDVLIDGAGAALAALAGALGLWSALRAATLGLLLVAALGGALAVVADLLVGASPGALWLTVPAAALTLLLVIRR
jgi:VanZ family protein